MTPLWLESLLNATNPDTVRSLIRTYRLALADVTWLKEHSAQFYYDQPVKAVAIAHAAQQLARELPSPAPALGDWTLANALMFADRYQEAATLYADARQSYLSQGEELEAARMGIGQVWALAYLGQFAAAIQLAFEIEPVLAAANTPADTHRLGGLYNNLGIVYELTGQFEEALAAYDRKLALLPVSETLQHGRVQHNRGVALTWLNAFAEASAAFGLAEMAFTGAEANADLARLYFNRGILHTCRADYQAASAAFQTSCHFMSEHDEPLLRVECELYAALSQLQAGITPDDQLLTDLHRLKIAFATHGPLIEEGLAWLGLARAYLGQAQFLKAENALLEATRVAKTEGGATLAWQVVFHQAELAEMRQEEVEAIAYYQVALTEIESIRHRLQSDIFRATFLIDKTAVYQKLISLHIRRGEVEAALAVLERGRSRLLLERLMSRLTDDLTLLAQSDSPQFTRLKALLTEIEEITRALQGEGLGERGGWLPNVAPERQIHLRRLEREATAVVQQLQHFPSRSWPLTLQPLITLPDLQASLADMTLLYYYYTSGWVNCLAIQAGRVTNYSALAPSREVEKEYNDFRAAIERTLGIAAHYGLERFDRYLPPLLNDVERHLGQLYDWLWRPLAPQLSENVLIIPEGTLHYLPFQALYDRESTPPTYVVERYTVSYAPGATIWDWCRRLQPQADEILLLGYGGNQLPQVPVELETLRQRWPEAVCQVGDDATTALFQQHAPQSRLIHLAAHARFRADELMLSAFTLADRPLTLLEISRLPLAAELVVLSGCETAGGQLHGNDLFSLATGFLGSGTRTLLSTLWRVDDTVTAALMNRFYTHWTNGNSPAAALRLAQQWLFAQSKVQPELAGSRHPAYWAPFTILGAT